MKKRNKILAGVLISGILATSGMLVGCNGGDNGEPLKNTTDVYAFAGATTGILMSDQEISAQMLTSASIASTENATPTLDELKKQLDEAIAQTLDKYMGVFDSVVGGNKPVDVKDVASDKENFKHKLTISANSIDGQKTVCVLYYNETLLNDEEVEVEDSDDEEHETKLEGELYFNGSETPLYVFGKKEIDPEDNEVEVTFEARYSKDDDKNKVVFKQEREENNGKVEEEYVFQIVVGGVTTEFSFEMEKDAKGNIEVEYEQTIGASKVSFEIEKNVDNSITIETKDFFAQELEINVYVEKSEDQTQERYVYTLKKLGKFDLGDGLTFNGNWR